jgi:hypothetical protein
VIWRYDVATFQYEAVTDYGSAMNRYAAGFAFPVPEPSGAWLLVLGSGLFTVRKVMNRREDDRPGSAGR